MQMKRTVLVVDDHIVVSNGLGAILRQSNRYQEVRQATSGREAIRMVGQEEFDAVVLDISLPDMSGIDVVAELVRLRPRLPIVMFTMHGDREYCVRALRAGARGYVTKDESVDHILAALAQAERGRRYLCPAVAEEVTDALFGGFKPDRSPHEALSDREFEVLRQIGAGRRVSEIAERLCLSVKTVSTYRSRVLTKLDMKNSAQLMRYALVNGVCE